MNPIPNRSRKPKKLWADLAKIIDRDRAIVVLRRPEFYFIQSQHDGLSALKPEIRSRFENKLGIGGTHRAFVAAADVRNIDHHTRNLPRTRLPPVRQDLNVLRTDGDF